MRTQCFRVESNLSSDKTGMLVFGLSRHRHQFDQIIVTLDNSSQLLTAKNLGVPCTFQWVGLSLNGPHA